jgi:hypothetical protein
MLTQIISKYLLTHYTSRSYVRTYHMSIINTRNLGTKILDALYWNDVRTKCQNNNLFELGGGGDGYDDTTNLIFIIGKVVPVLN